MQRIWPIRIMHQPSVQPYHVEAVIAGAWTMVELADVADMMPVDNYGAWRLSDYALHGELVPWRSVDWYLARGRQASRNGTQLNSHAMVEDMFFEPWRRVPHYDVLVTDNDLYAEDNAYVLGESIPGYCLVISSFRFRELTPREQASCLQALTEHELGHVFGLPPTDRQEDVEERLGKHCTRRCVMRQCENVEQWKAIAHERVCHGPLCERCLQDLRQYFV